jgi:hypothetical protein
MNSNLFHASDVVIIFTIKMRNLQLTGKKLSLLKWALHNLVRFVTVSLPAADSH